MSWLRMCITSSLTTSRMVNAIPPAAAIFYLLWHINLSSLDPYPIILTIGNSPTTVCILASDHYSYASPRHNAGHRHADRHDDSCTSLYSVSTVFPKINMPPNLLPLDHKYTISVKIWKALTYSSSETSPSDSNTFRWPRKRASLCAGYYPLEYLSFWACFATYGGFAGLLQIQKKREFNPESLRHYTTSYRQSPLLRQLASMKPFHPN
jgi:hypothetical protein